MDATLQRKLRLVLFLCRLSVAIVIAVWGIDKLLRPEHGADVAGTFYGLKGLPASLFLAIGVFQILVVAAYMTGFMKRWVSLYILVICAMPLASPHFLAGFWEGVMTAPHPKILTFATFALCACAYAVYSLRDYDTLGAAFSKQREPST